MKKKIKNSSVKKGDKGIEVSMGNGQLTKYEIMKAVAKKYSIYEATVWLNTPTEDSEGKTPAELMMDGDFKLLKKIINKLDEQSDD